MYRVLRNTLLVVIILVAIVFGGKIFFTPSQLLASNKVQYKVVNYVDWGAGAAQYEKGLNNMANQGWIYDHKCPWSGFIVFKKQ